MYNPICELLLFGMKKTKILIGERGMTRYDVSMSNAFTNINESDENMGYEENNLNSLKLRHFGDDEFNTGIRNEDDFRAYSFRRRKDKKKRRRTGEEPRKQNNARKVVNLPASQPYVKIMDGEERLCFKYNTKISELALNAMPKGELEDNEFCVRFDLESVDISKLNEKFKADNCIYPRANIPYELYTGNRWNYETECNRLAWQFVSLNPVLLYGKKGLIQRAVDSYRNINKTNKGHKFYKDSTFYGDIEKRRHASPTFSSVHIQWVARGSIKRCKIHTNVEYVDYSVISDEFKAKYSVLDDVFDENSFGCEKWESRNSDNELAVKIAFLNVENVSFLNAIRAIGLYSIIKKAVEAYKSRKDELLSSDDDADAQEVVNDALNRAFNDVEEAANSQMLSRATNN